METGDIVFFKGESWISSLITSLTGSSFSHVALAVNDEKVIEADRFIKCRIRKINAEEIVTLKRVKGGLTKEEKNQLLNLVPDYLGRPYDYGAIARWFFRLLFKWELPIVDKANALYCTELVDRLYMQIGKDIVPGAQIGDITPFHLESTYMLEDISQ
ncbi:YiiX/YebB-like N1pC/P60 family cysteine hydrolase [Rossellomorea vietnamensis]|uniref:YiiX/YebB-like N1pC/P60 family cysteine hydrolase n=1 Tax=Rossellomorea vietnamensis TaxID=218284 RepID=UPI003CF8D9C7